MRLLDFARLMMLVKHRVVRGKSHIGKLEKKAANH